MIDVERISFEAAKEYIRDIKAKDSSGFPPSAHYRRAKPGGPSCAGCRYFDADQGYCNRYDADATANMVCDSFAPPEE